MGYATAEVLAADGASVAIVGRNAERAAAAAERLQAGVPGSRVVAVVGDVSRSGDAARIVADAVGAFGALDGVAVHTGILGHEPITISDDDWDAVFRDVFLGTSRIVEHALPHLVERGGTIVTTSAFSIRAPEHARIPYTSMKAAVATLTKAIARTYGKNGVRANCVCPGAIETEALVEIRHQLAEAKGIPVEEALEWVMKHEWELDIAMGRAGKPQEVGELIAFLLSPRAGYLTGALINIDGGTAF